MARPAARGTEVAFLPNIKLTIAPELDIIQGKFVRLTYHIPVLNLGRNKIKPPTNQKLLPGSIGDQPTTYHIISKDHRPRTVTQ